MLKSEIAKDMQKATGSSFITRSGLQKYMGCKDVKTVDKYLDGLERVSGKYYFIPDVAESLKRHAEC